jgi:hypothetical protein
MPAPRYQVSQDSGIVRMVEAVGVEPTSELPNTMVSTCVSSCLI